MLTRFPVLHVCVKVAVSISPAVGLSDHTPPCSARVCEVGDVLGAGERVRVLGKFFLDWLLYELH